MKIKKVLLICIFLLSSIFAFGKEYKAIEKVKNFSFEVAEINYLGKKQKKILYKVQMNLPNNFKKEILFPALNKGEIYLYTDKTKTVYLPIFDQKKTTSLEKDEVQVLNVIDILVERLSSDKKFKKAYYEKKNVEFVLEENYKVRIVSYLDIDGYVFPKKWLIEEKGQKVLELTLSKVVMDPKLTERDFQIS